MTVDADRRFWFAALPDLATCEAGKPYALEILRGVAWEFMDELIESGEKLLSICTEADCDSISCKTLPDPDSQELSG